MAANGANVRNFETQMTEQVQRIADNLGLITMVNDDVAANKANVKNFETKMTEQEGRMTTLLDERITDVERKMVEEEQRNADVLREKILEVEVKITEQESRTTSLLEERISGIEGKMREQEKRTAKLIDKRISEEVDKVLKEQDKKLAEQDRRNNEKFDEFKREITNKIAEQEEIIAGLEEKNAEQEEEIARQTEIILRNEKKIRDQRNAIVKLNEVVLVPESVLLLTGGTTSGDYILSSVEVFPSTSGCSLPPLPTTRRYHVTFLTSEPDPVIATCGGALGTGQHGGSTPTSSCLVLDQSNQRWDDSRMSSLTESRYGGATARLNSIGVFIIGGHASSLQGTSDFLAAGSLQWQKGPELPVQMHSPCAVTITTTSFLSISDYNIYEYDAAIAGPTSTDGWREASRWPKLKTKRKYGPACAKVGQKVVIAGGWNSVEGNIDSTEVLDLDSRTIRWKYQGTSITRRHFHLRRVKIAGKMRTFALGWTSAVMEWMEGNSTFKWAGYMREARYGFGAVAVPRELVCPA